MGLVFADSCLKVSCEVRRIEAYGWVAIFVGTDIEEG